MGLFCTNISGGSAPQQPSYGEGMADAMKAQMEMLTGQTLGKDESFEELYASALGREGGTLADIIRQFEAPLRRETAQIDTDILRQTILGGEQKTDDQGRVLLGYEPPPVSAGKSYRLELTSKKSGEKVTAHVKGSKELPRTGSNYYGYQLWDNEGKLIAEDYAADFDNRQSYTPEDARARIQDRFFDYVVEKGYIDRDKVDKIIEADDPSKFIIQPDAPLADRTPIYETDPSTGQPKIYKNAQGEVLKNSPVREGTGMVDVLGDIRAVQQAEQGEDYAQYVRDNPDLNQQFNDARRGGDQRTIEEFGRDHYEFAGKAEGRELPMGDYTMQDTGRQAGFDEQGNFLGLAALAEDVQRGHLSRQREADLMDVARLSDQYQDIMEDYRPGTQEALDSASKILKEREKGLTGGAITVPTGSTYGGDVGATTLAAAPKLSADTAFSGELAAAGADPLRQRLLADAKTALGDTLTAREERQIAEAMRGRSTMMGRVFDDSAIHEEAKARLLEDRNRQAVNRAFAQSVLGQEAGLQTGDLGRGMQQEAQQADITQRRDLAQFGADVDRARMEQAQAQQAGQFDVGAKMDAERIGEQLKQSGTLGYIDAATRLAALEDQHTLDPFQAILGRGGGGSLGAGQSLFGQAGYGLQSGPQYLNPEAGLGYISNMAANQASMYGAGQMADASRSAGMMGMFGNIGRGVAGIFG